MIGVPQSTIKMVGGEEGKKMPLQWIDVVGPNSWDMISLQVRVSRGRQ